MKLLYLIYTHNRIKILQECLNTLFNNNDIKPDRCIIVDDGSNPSMKDKLYSFTSKQNIDFVNIIQNVGYGAAAEIGMRMACVFEPEYLFIIESDYVFAKNGLDTVMDIFENTKIGQLSAGFSGYDNPDFYDKSKTDVVYRDIIKMDCGEDNLNREIMYKPFEINTQYGTKKLEFVSNSCGTMYFNWKNVKKIKEQFPQEFEYWIKQITKDKKILNDGMMSHGMAWMWTKWAKANNIDINSYSALLNIKPSVADHINGGGINGYIVPEGQSFVASPTFTE